MTTPELAERLIACDTSTPAGVGSGIDLVESWLVDRSIEVTRFETGPGLSSLVARRGRGAARIVMYGHVDVVPGAAEQFRPRRDGDRLLGRGAYDMKAALAAMMGAIAAHSESSEVEALLVVVPDEERTDLQAREGGAQNSTHALAEMGVIDGDLAILGEPTDLDIGVEAKGVLMLRIPVMGVSAHGSTPWKGENAILRAVDLYRAITGLPFASQASAGFSGPSINLARIQGGEALNQVPDTCWIDVDIRYVPGQSPVEIAAQIAELGAVEPTVVLNQEPIEISPHEPLVAELIASAARTGCPARAIGRHGASDAVAFTRRGIPAVEFGPIGAGHHGPKEYVDLVSVEKYERALISFLARTPARMATAGVA